jgi:hypothetical protein
MPRFWRARVRHAGCIDAAMPRRASAFEPFSFEPPSGWSSEETLTFEKDGAGDVGPTRLVLRRITLTEGDTLDAFVARVLEEERNLPDFAVVERGALRAGGLDAIKARVRFRRGEEIVASTFAFVDAESAGVLVVGCSTTRRSESERDAVTTAQWTALEAILTSLRVRSDEGANDAAQPPRADDDALLGAVPMPWQRRTSRTA